MKSSRPFWKESTWPTSWLKKASTAKTILFSSSKIKTFERFVSRYRAEYTLRTRAQYLCRSGTRTQTGEPDFRVVKSSASLWQGCSSLSHRWPSWMRLETGISPQIYHHLLLITIHRLRSCRKVMSCVSTSALDSENERRLYCADAFQEFL